MAKDQEIVTQNRKQIVQRLESSELQKRLIGLIPSASQVTKRRFMNAAMSIWADPALASCTQSSCLMAVYHCAKLGLIPDQNLGHVWIIPYREGGRAQAQVQVGYKGRCELARRSGHINAIRTRVVYANDLFHYVDGMRQECKHVPWDFNNKPESGDPYAAYCVAEFANGTFDLHVCGRATIMDSKKRSKAASRGTGPWVTDELAMWLVVPIRRAWRTWPQSVEMATVEQLDMRSEDGDPQSTPQEMEEILGTLPQDEEESGGWGPQPSAVVEPTDEELAKQPDDFAPLSEEQLQLKGKQG